MRWHDDCTGGVEVSLPTTSPEPVRVLLVDDNDSMIARAAAALTPRCVVVGTAHNGAEALDAVGTLRPDVVVLDISMPGMTGLEVASTLRQQGSTAAVVFLTVHDDKDFLDAASPHSPCRPLPARRQGSPCRRGP